MTRPISTRTHAMLDNTWAAAALALPESMREAPRMARLVRQAGVMTTMYSALTNNERGTLRVLPMRTHLMLDALVSGALLVSPLFVPRAERRWAAFPILLGGLGLLAALFTETRAPFEIAEEEGFTPPGEVADALADDPDLARSPQLRVHLE